MKSNARVSVIIVNLNGRGHLPECLESLMATEAGKQEIVLVDNGSLDDSCSYVTDTYPHVKLISLSRNHGFAEANNIGASAAAGAYLVFLNNDTAVTPGWLDPLLSVLVLHPRIGVAGSKLLFYGMRERVNSAGADLMFSGGGYDVGFMDFDSTRYNSPALKGAVCGAAMMVRKAEFLSLGGFDPRYFMYFEDVDLCWRYWLKGYLVAYLPSSVVYHKFGGSAGSTRDSPLRVFYGTRNSLLNVLKNRETRHLPVSLLFNFAHHALKCLGFVVSGRLGLAAGMVRAYRAWLRLVPEALRKRKAIQGARVVSDRFLMESGLMVSLSGALREYLRLQRSRMPAGTSNARSSRFCR
ncbi:MAG: glycosyltransferase family 2 protein [Thermodesulfobacteriota bacterium]